MTSRKNSVDRLRESDVEFHELSESEQDEWMDQIGYQNTDLWEDEINKFVGSVDRLERLAEAARSESDITVPEHPDKEYQFGIREE